VKRGHFAHIRGLRTGLEPLVSEPLESSAIGEFAAVIGVLPVEPNELS
jgi:hypothetical protein